MDMKTIQIALLLILNTQLYSQEICDDLIIYDEWEFDTYEAVDWNYGDTLGYFADGNLPIIAVLDYSEVPTGTLFMDASYPGL